MSQEKQKDHTQIGAVIILVISAIVFIPVGGYEVFNAFFNNRKVPTFGAYDGKKITYEAGTTFTTITENLAERYKQMGYNLDSQSYYYLFSQAFEETVKDMAYLDAVKKSGYTVPESEENRMLIQYYSDETGNYSQRVYNQTDKATRESLKEGVNLTLTFNRFSDDLTGSNASKIKGESLYGIKTPSKEIDFIKNMGSEKHSFSYVAFGTEDFPKSESAKWAQNNLEKFVKYDLSAVTVHEESDANALLKHLNNNEITFEDAVSERSQKYYTETDGKVSRPYNYQLAISIENDEDVSKVSSLSKGQLSPVIKTTRGYTIYRCDGTATPADLSNDETLSIVETYIKTNEHGYIENYFTQIANDFVSQASLSTFDEASEKFGVTPVTTTAFPINYGTSALYAGIPTTYSDLNSLSTSADILQKIFALQKNEMSEPVLVGMNVMVFKCLSIINDDAVSESDTIKSQIASVNKNTATQTLMRSDKVENNIWSAYFENFANLGENN